jgi:hypothetical protein
MPVIGLIRSTVSDVTENIDEYDEPHDDYPFILFNNEFYPQTEPDEEQEELAIEPESESNLQEYADVQDFFEGLTNHSEEQIQQTRNEKVNIIDKPDNDELLEEKEEEIKGLYEVNDFEEIFNNNIEITPFDTQSADTQWVRISLREPIFLPIDYRYLVNHPLTVASYKKYNHLILGRITNNGKIDYVLGVPGIFESQYVSAVRQMGFTQFKTVIDSGVLRQGDYGYWLCPIQKHM